MDCSRFLEHLADYAACRVTDLRLSRALARHERACAACRRALKALPRGLDELGSLAPIEPSDSFRDRLDARLRRESAIVDPVPRTRAGLAAALLIGAALGVLLLEHFDRGDPGVPLAAESQDDRAPSFREPALDATLAPFAESTLEFHSGHAPLATFTTLAR